LSVQVDREHYEALQVYYDGIYLPITEYVTFKLDNNIGMFSYCNMLEQLSLKRLYIVCNTHSIWCWSRHL